MFLIKRRKELVDEAIEFTVLKITGKAPQEAFRRSFTD